MKNNKEIELIEKYLGWIDEDLCCKDIDFLLEEMEDELKNHIINEGMAKAGMIRGQMSACYELAIKSARVKCVKGIYENYIKELQKSLKDASEKKKKKIEDKISKAKERISNIDSFLKDYDTTQSSKEKHKDTKKSGGDKKQSKKEYKESKKKSKKSWKKAVNHGWTGTKI